MRLPAASTVVAMAVCGAAASAYAETFSYSCEARGQTDILRIDDGGKKLLWRGKTYKTRMLGQKECERYGVRATRPGEQFDFCTATRGYGDFIDHGVNVVCHQITVPEDYLGKWSLVPEDNSACGANDTNAEVTTDNIQTYSEDYCTITAVNEVKEPGDPRVEISCIAGGEGGPETKAHETWRLKKIFGKLVFMQQTAGGVTLWRRCGR